MKVLRRVPPEKLGAGITKAMYDDGPYQITEIFGPKSFRCVHLVTGEVIKTNVHLTKKYTLRSEIPRMQLLQKVGAADLHVSSKLACIIKNTMSSIVSQNQVSWDMHSMLPVPTDPIASIPHTSLCSSRQQDAQESRYINFCTYLTHGRDPMTKPVLSNKGGGTKQFKGAKFFPPIRKQRTQFMAPFSPSEADSFQSSFFMSSQPKSHANAITLSAMSAIDPTLSSYSNFEKVFLKEALNELKANSAELKKQLIEKTT